MPKIIIREYDNTKANNGAYENFAVVVPGVMGIPEEFDPEKFDENLVCEVSSKKDFEKYIGKNKGEAIAPILTDVSAYSEGTPAVEKFIVAATYSQTAATFWSDAHAAGKVYTCTGADETTKSAGHLVYVNGENSYTLTKLEPSSDFPSTGYVAVIEDKLLEGCDAVAHQGNQIAYELCGLGYTVLFKVIPYAQTGTLAQIEGSTFWECFKDKSTYDFRYITTGGYIKAEAYKCIRDVATFVKDTDAGRGDCVALLDADENYSLGTATTAVGKIKEFVNSLTSVALNKYCSIFAPKVYYSNYVDSDYGTNCFPATFDYLVCAAYARNNLNFAEWYAVAGYNRGTSDWTIKNTSVNLGEIAVNELQPRHADSTGTSALAASVNVITKIRGNYYLWGNRTAHTLAGEDLVASHFLNIRQLCSTLKKDIWNACKELTFDPNSDVLWGTFCNKIKATLEKMKADQGIADYRILKVKSNVKAQLTAKVRIVPIEAVEDFDISIYLEDSLTGVDVKASED